MEYKRIKGKPTTKYETYDNHIKGITKNGGTFYIDKEDYELIKDWSWYIDNYGYVSSTIKKERVQMHRLIMGCKKGDKLEIDHINRIKTDNRKENLRKCSRKENQRNKHAMKTNKTGVRGVCYEKERNKWRVQINTNKGRKRFRCDTLEEAIKLRKELEKEFWK